MRFRYHGKRYKINLFPFFVALLILVVVIALLIGGCRKKEPASPSPSSSGADTASAASLSEPASVSASSGGDLLSGGARLSDPVISIPEPQALPAGSLSDWNLILLNPEDGNAITTDLNIQLAQFDQQQVDSRAADAYQAMCDGAAEAGITLYLRSGYRSIATQEANYQNSVQREMAAGATENEAIRRTNLYYTVPGHSEHHTGLAFDIITPEYHQYVYELDDRFATQEPYSAAYQWLVSNCARYGFILRYPQDKTAITRIQFEPWHYRYVGVEHAEYIMSHNLCLEEYIELLKEAGR